MAAQGQEEEAQRREAEAAAARRQEAEEAARRQGALEERIAGIELALAGEFECVEFAGSSSMHVVRGALTRDHASCLEGTPAVELSTVVSRASSVGGRSSRPGGEKEMHDDACP